MRRTNIAPAPTSQQTGQSRATRRAPRGKIPFVLKKYVTWCALDPTITTGALLCLGSGADWDRRFEMAAAACSPTEATDEQLVEQVLAGRRNAFDLLYARYLRRVYGFVDRRLSNRADVEETTQEVFIQIFSALGSYRGDAPFAAWALGIARYTVAARFKKRQHPMLPLETDANGDLDVQPGADTAPSDSNPLAQYELHERVRELEALALKRLSKEQRKVFSMHHLQHRSIAEIAKAEGKSPDAVKSNLYRARRLLFAP